MCYRRHTFVVAIACALALTLPTTASAEDQATPPIFQSLDAAARIPQLSRDAQAVIGNIEGLAIGARLFVILAATEERGNDHLIRLALELQSVVHDQRGNYLYALYAVLASHDPERALTWANRLVSMGVAVNVTSGHFHSLAHLDPSAPLPAVHDQNIATTPMALWVDRFVRADYRSGYRPFRRGSLSEVLQLTYRDGTVLDIDIRAICDNRDPAPLQSMARAYLGPGGRLYPLRLNRDTTPRLWRAKHERALAGMHRSNRAFETFASLGVAAVFSNLPAGPVTGVSAPSTGASSATIRSPSASPTTRPRTNLNSDRSSTATPIPSNKPLPAYGRIVRRADRAPMVLRTPRPHSWPPSPPSGPKPGLSDPGAAAWRYQRYLHNAYRQGKAPADILPFATWHRRHFEPAVRGGRPGSPGGPAHRDDVGLNNEPNGIKGEKVGDRIPDGVGRQGQTVVIRGQSITPNRRGRVIIESDHLIRGGTIPDSAARAQVRDIRKAEPSATIVVTDQANPTTAPLIYPPGKQPPPPGPLPGDQPPVVSYP